MTRRLYISLTLIVLLSVISISSEFTTAKATPNQNINAAANIISVSTAQEFQDALYDVAVGGVIELATGTYNPTGVQWASNTSGNYFKIPADTQKYFIIRAAEGTTPIISEGQNEGLVRNINSSISLSGWIVYEGITFSDGISTVDGIAAGVTLHYANATFIDCIFQNNNGSQPITGGGGAFVGIYSTAFFFNTTWSDNRATNEGAGLAVNGQATAYVHQSQFTNNRTNYEGHRTTAAGGAIHIGNSILRVSNSYFEGNQAASAGGAIYARRDWVEDGGGTSPPEGDIIISNCSFVENIVFPGLEGSPFGEGGAVHTEDQITIKIYSSRFIKNSSREGGAVTLYRSIAEIDNSVFLGNNVWGTGGSTGFGGAISSISSDVQAIDGDTNRRFASLLVENTYIQGRYEEVTIIGQSSGGIYVAGDKARMYGANGATQMGTLDDNRAITIIRNVVFYDTDVEKEGGSATAGGMLGDLANITIEDSLFLNADAGTVPDANSSGGALALLNQSTANIVRSTFSNNVAGRFGGGLFVQASEMTLSDSAIIYNESGSSGGGLRIEGATLASDVQKSSEVTINNTVIANNLSGKWGGGVSVKGSTLNIINSSILDNEVIPTGPNPWQSGGAAILTNVDDARGLPATGSVDNCIISNNIGLAIFDIDNGETGQLSNEMQYRDNQFFTTFADSKIYGTVGGANFPNAFEDVAGLNALLVVRNNGTSTDKAPDDDNQILSTPFNAIVGAVLAAPNQILSVGNPWDSFPTTSYIGYAWDGGPATLNGNPVSGNSGLAATTSSGTHTLMVGDTIYSTNIIDSATPAAELMFAARNPSATLSWNVTEGFFLAGAIDLGVGQVPASGSISASLPGTELRHRFYVITKEGGVVVTKAEDPILVAPSAHFLLLEEGSTGNTSQLHISNGGGKTLNWTASTTSPELLTVNTPSGSTTTYDTVGFSVDITGLPIGLYVGYIDIDAGQAGSQNAEITIKVVEEVYNVWLPVAFR